MKRLILFSMVCLMTTVIQAQNETTAENDFVAWDKMLSEIFVTGHRHIVRMKGNTLVAQVANSIKCKLNSYVFMLKTYAFGHQKLYVAEVYSYNYLVMYCILVIKTIRNSCI